jgi:hypothetical protein
MLNQEVQLKKLVVFTVCALAGCASQTGIVPTGSDSFMVSRQDNGFTAAVGSLKAENLKEAAQYCASKGQKFEVKASEDIERALGKIPQSTLYFRCV